MRTFIKSPILLVILCVTLVTAIASSQSLYEKIVNSLTAPTADACVESEPCADGETASPNQAVQTGPRDGQTVYTIGCAVCHDGGIGGAPVFGSKSAWQPLLKQGTESLVQSVKNGKGSMPPKGLCQDCTDEELLSAVTHMLQSF